MRQRILVPELNEEVTVSLWEGADRRQRLYITRRDGHYQCGYFDLSRPGAPWVRPARGDMAHLIPAIRAALEAAGILPVR